MVKETKRAAIYTRLSPNPKKTDTINQDRDLKNFAAGLDWPIVANYCDMLASGSRKDRPKFKQMMEDARQRKFDVVLFWSLDRFSREGVLETLQYLNTLKSYNVDYRSYTEQYIDSCGIFKDAVISIMATVAKQERVRLVERITAGLQTARDKGIVLGRRFKTEKTAKNPRPITLEEVLKLRGEGISGNQISKMMKCSNATISRMLKRHREGNINGL